ncbi:hypothetical protein BDC45DRAFT_532506 [Circinella umbellata]|nr:hypothetical protein BDC45DRAFT_532506 [Circinella umbellata]
MVQRLPLEIIIRILSYVSISDCAQLTSSCRFWHEFIVNQPPGIWTHGDISEVTGQYHALPKWYNSYLDSKGKQCIKSIKLDISTPDDKVRSTSSFNRIAQEKWNKVESLEIVFRMKPTFVKKRRHFERFTTSYHLPGILYTIHEYCNDTLQSFSFKPVEFKTPNRMSFIPFVGISATYSRLLTQQEGNNNNNRKKLEILEFIPKCPSYDYEEKDPKIDEMAWITQKNHSTLKSLIFELDPFAMTDVKSLQVLAELGAPNLTKLVLRQNNHLCRLTPTVLAGLIKAFPNLHTVELCGTNFWNDTVLEALGDLLNLRQCSMYLDNHGMTMEPTPPKDDQGIILVEAIQSF